MSVSLGLLDGRRIDLARPRAEDILIEDIALALSNVCRFAGHIRPFYSVAQHSVLVSHLCRDDHKLAGLLHDASEAYMGDVTRNLKHSEYMVGYRMLETVLQSTIEARFHLLDVDHAHIKHCDDLAACYERVVIVDHQAWGPNYIYGLHARGFMKSDPKELIKLAHLLPQSFVAQESTVAENLFRIHYNSYQDRRL